RRGSRLSTRRRPGAMARMAPSASPEEPEGPCGGAERSSEATVSVTVSAVSGQAATCTRPTRRRSARVTPGSSAPWATTRGALWPRRGEIMSSKLAGSLGVEEVGGHHFHGDVDVLQRIGGDQSLADTVRPVLQQAEADVLLQRRAVGGGGDVA